MIKLNKRLAMVSSFVGDNLSLIDVGCDHAFLSIYLKENRNNIKILASDKNIGPLSIARENIKKYGYEDKIDTILMDGINNIPEYIDTIVISGMGSITMTKILVKEKLKNVKKIILSPNNDFYLIRDYVSKLGYKITKEDIVLENGKYYPVILFEKGNKKYNDIELEYGPLLIKTKNNNFINYLNYKMDEIKKIVNNLDKSSEAYKKFSKELLEINQIIG